MIFIANISHISHENHFPFLPLLAPLALDFLVLGLGLEAAFLALLTGVLAFFTAAFLIGLAFGDFLTGVAFFSLTTFSALTFGLDLLSFLWD